MTLMQRVQKKSVFYDLVQEWCEEWSKWDPYASKVRETEPMIHSYMTILTQIFIYRVSAKDDQTCQSLWSRCCTDPAAATV